MKKILIIFLIASFAIAQKTNQDSTNITILLNKWHQDAAKTNFDNYFDAMTDDAIFIGTDASENWDKKAFKAFAKPYFDNGKAWNFISLKRNIYFSKDKKTAWFDELLDTQMKICRGSGVLIKDKNRWKIKHYVLSMTIPNNNSEEVIKIKAPIEDAFIEKLKK